MRYLRRQYARGLDLLMCHAMDRIQRRHHLPPASQAAFQAYLTACETLTPAEFFSAPPLQPLPDSSPQILRWSTPRPSGFAENDTATALLFIRDPAAPTVIMLHALMSTSDQGYRRSAQRFNDAGWSACFLHLPYHYSRVPRSFRNGELAISPDLVRNGQGLRQGVSELRQLLAFLRARGSPAFGLWATSYGGWLAALLLGVEPDFRFALLMAPIVNVQHAIWESATGRHLRSELLRCGITSHMVQRHAHLTFPAHVQPLCPPAHIILGAGLWDQIVRPADVRALHLAWPGSSFFTVEQGHFGYRMLDHGYAQLVQRGLMPDLPYPRPASFMDRGPLSILKHWGRHDSPSS